MFSLIDLNLALAVGIDDALGLRVCLCMSHGRADQVRYEFWMLAGKEKAKYMVPEKPD